MARVNGTTSARGYGTIHQKLRAYWKPAVESGQVDCHAVPCLEERDGRSKRIAPGEPWHLGHTPDRSSWTGPEHQRCGASDGARRGNQQQPRFIMAATGHGPRCGTCGTEYHYAARQCTICGSHYHPSRKIQYTCSRACGVAFKRLTYGNGSGVLPSPRPACEVCGKPCAGLQQRTCSTACYAKLRSGQRQELICERCGGKFMGFSARWCSPNCQALAYYYANREKVLDRMREKREAVASRAW